MRVFTTEFKRLVQLQSLINKLAILSDTARHASSLLYRLRSTIRPGPRSAPLRSALVVLVWLPAEGGAGIFESVKGALASVKNDAIFAARLP